MTGRGIYVFCVVRNYHRKKLLQENCQEYSQKRRIFGR